MNFCRITVDFGSMAEDGRWVHSAAGEGRIGAEVKRIGLQQFQASGSSDYIIRYIWPWARARSFHISYPSSRVSTSAAPPAPRAMVIAMANPKCPTFMAAKPSSPDEEELARLLCPATPAPDCVPFLPTSSDFTLVMMTLRTPKPIQHHHEAEFYRIRGMRDAKGEITVSKIMTGGVCRGLNRILQKNEV
ncbi:hypothetical protein BJ912DRAFT_1041731 [Pholiota molesta]|nr:hypothetical protein BJ912DRAFT_1041731 [Pholiota molesta]